MYSNDPNLRSAGQKVNMSPKIMEQYVRASTDILYFGEQFFYIVSIDEGKMLINLHEYQKRVLKAFVGDDDDPRNNSILLSSRQIGKCQNYTTIVKLRNKSTGEIKEVEVGSFFDKSADLTAQ